MKNSLKHLKWIQLFSTVIVLLSLAISPLESLKVNRASAQASRKIFLPIAAHGYRDADPVLLGVYPHEYMGEQKYINSSLKDLDQWSGKQTSIVATFMDFENLAWYDIREPMELLWDNGYTAFVNLMTSKSAADIANGRLDNDIREYAAEFALWVAYAKQEKQERIIFLAPMPEANLTNGNSYGGDPQAFKSAYWRIQDIFREEFSKQNVPFDTIHWVFAPNGVDEPDKPTFEAYYPGDDITDVVAFSSYNAGYCVGWEYDRWQLGDELYKPFVERMRALAPGKPIFISQTGSTSEYPQHGSFDHNKKSEWFEEAYSYLATIDGVRAVLYFNINSGCDWEFFRSGDLYFEGYRQVVQTSAFGYLNPDEMIDSFSNP